MENVCLAKTNCKTLKIKDKRIRVFMTYSSFTTFLMINIVFRFLPCTSQSLKHCYLQFNMNQINVFNNRKT